MPKFENIQPSVNPKPIEVQRVDVRIINREASERAGYEVWGLWMDGYLRKKPL